MNAENLGKQALPAHQDLLGHLAHVETGARGDNKARMVCLGRKACEVRLVSLDPRDRKDHVD